MSEQTRLPTYALSHGGGPWPWIKDSFIGDWGPLERSLQAIPDEVGVRPKAILSVSAHWFGPQFAVQTSAAPAMYYDYVGFPAFTTGAVPAPGSPEVAERIVELLRGAGLPVGRDPQRGYDHGTFVPLAVAYPHADVPVLQLSLHHGFDAAVHLELGRAIAPLRDEGVLILGSGMPSFHDLSRLGPPSTAPSTAFDRWLVDTVVGHVGPERSRILERWRSAPSALVCHPQPDHLLPLMVAIGAAETEAVLQYHEDAFMGFTAASSFRMGTTMVRTTDDAAATGAGVR